jgi:hypothetical protein
MAQLLNVTGDWFFVVGEEGSKIQGFKGSRMQGFQCNAKELQKVESPAKTIRTLFRQIERI